MLYMDNFHAVKVGYPTPRSRSMTQVLTYVHCCHWLPKELSNKGYHTYQTFLNKCVGKNTCPHSHRRFVYIIIPPANEVAGAYSDPYVRPFVRSSVRPSVRPSKSLIRYSSKTAEQNFMKLLGIVHYMMPYCTSYLKFLSA